MKEKIIILSILTAAVLLGGCGNRKDDLALTEKNTANNTMTPAAECETVSADSTELETPPSDEEPIEYAEANYFIEKVTKIIYHRNGKDYDVSPDTEEGKQIILLAEKRYVHTAEQPLKNNKLKGKVVDLKKNGRALEIQFNKSTQQTFEGGKLNNFKNVFVDFQGWFFPLEGDEAEYFTPLPNQECTFRRLGSSEKILEYLEKNIVKD